MGKRLPLHILLAEDHATNQRLALLTLERLGYRADVAANGLEVLAALDRQAYDVILMDMQMPQMDGLEATRLIRGRGAGICQPRIIAMTANVTRDDRQACLDAGMNDYLAKPIRVDELVAALNKSRYIADRNPSPAQTGLPQNMTGKGLVHKHSGPTSLDRDALDRLLKLVGGDQGKYFELIDSFMKETPKLLNGIRKAVADKDSELLRRMSHTLKSTSQDFGAVELAKLGERLETISKLGNLGDASELVQQADRQYASVDRALKVIRAGGNNAG